MPPTTHVYVKVPDPKEGETPRLVPVPSNEGSSAGGGLLRATPGKVYRMPWSSYVRRRITGGDFVLVNKSGTAVKNRIEANASGFVRIAPDGSVDKDQRPDEEVAIAAAADAKIAADKAKIAAAAADKGKV